MNNIKIAHVYNINDDVLVVADNIQKACELYCKYYDNPNVAQCIDNVELVKTKKLGCIAIIEERE